MPNARNNGPYKIDASLYQGLTQVVAAIEEDLGIPIQHAVSLNFDQFANIVTALGGINMAFPRRVFDAGGGPRNNVPGSTSEGCVRPLNGTQALQVVRARHLRYETSQSNPTIPTPGSLEAQSDLARIRRDHEFLRVLASAAAKSGPQQPRFRLQPHQLGEGRPVVRSDVARERHGEPRLRLPRGRHQLRTPADAPGPVVSDPEGNGGLVYKGANYGDVEFPAEARTWRPLSSSSESGPRPTP